MKLLVATRNKDKFDIVNRMIHSIDSTIELVPLFEVEIQGDVAEEGTMEERATQKAEFFFNALQNSNNNDFDGVLGIDDGFQIEDQEPSPNSKELTDDLLEGKYPEGTNVIVVRAYALATEQGTRSGLSRVPFTFIGNKNRVTRTEGSYPLTKVLAPRGSTTPISEWTNEDSTKFTLGHSREILTDLLLKK